MNSDKETIIKKKSNPVWKYIFILLLIFNLFFLYFIRTPLLEIVRYGPGFTFYGLVILSGIVALVDFIAILPYIVTRHPQGMVKVISYAALIAISFVLMFAVPFFYTWLLRYF